MKHLVIRNFGPVENVDIELNRVNLIIGPQSSGKSTVLKVACFCDWMERQIELTQSPERICQADYFVRNLVSFHKLEGYISPDTYISYENDAVSFSYNAAEGKCSFRWKGNKRWKYRRPKIAYIPAERNLVAAIPNWYQVSMNKDNILDFMKEWEFARKTFSKGEAILDLPVQYRFEPNMASSDKIRLENGKELDLTVASSGLQSLIPLYVMLRYLTKEYYKETHSSVEQSTMKFNLLDVLARECPRMSEAEKQLTATNMLTPFRTDLFIEEPEAHIFPSTQKSFVYNLVGMLRASRNLHGKHSCFIATHSPYILTSFNNVIQAGERLAEVNKMSDDTAKAEKTAMIETIIPKSSTLRYSEVAAFEMKDGSICSIMDEEYHLISADAIDGASMEIGQDFDNLLNL